MPVPARPWMPDCGTYRTRWNWRSPTTVRDDGAGRCAPTPVGWGWWGCGSVWPPTGARCMPVPAGTVASWCARTSRSVGGTTTKSGATARKSVATPQQSGAAPHQSGAAPHQSGAAPHQSGATAHQSGATAQQTRSAHERLRRIGADMNNAGDSRASMRTGAPGPAEGDETVRVVLVDDQPLLREGIATILQAQADITVVGQASSGAEALEVVARTNPDVVCMDVEMPEMNGLEATRRIVGERPSGPRVLMLTTFNREDYLLEARRAGASAFLLKTARPEQLADAIRSVAAGDALLSPEVTRSIIERAVATGDFMPHDTGSTGVQQQTEDAVGPRTGHPHPAGREDPGDALPSGAAELTERERDVLRLVARGMSNSEIAEELVIGRATVKTHVSNVLMKLNLRDRVQAVAYAYQHGLAD